MRESNEAGPDTAFVQEVDHPSPPLPPSVPDPTSLTERLKSRKLWLTVGTVLYLVLTQLRVLPPSEGTEIAVVAVTGLYTIAEGVADAIERAQAGSSS